MKILCTASAGAAVSGDALVQVFPNKARLLELNSNVEKLFGDHLRYLSLEVMDDMGLEAGRVVVEDRGALDFTLKARMEVALLRGAEEVKL